jgi:hypothetical protein
LKFDDVLLIVRLHVLLAMTMKVTDFASVPPYSTIDGHRHQRKRMGQKGKFLPRRWRHHVPPKRWKLFVGLYVVTFHKATSFVS